MKTVLIIILTSLVVVFLVMMLNYATYNGSNKIKGASNLEKAKNNDQN